MKANPRWTSQTPINLAMRQRGSTHQTWSQSQVLQTLILPFEDTKFRTTRNYENF
jgi:hypothetical protein